jgi:hypothetical protein
MSGGYLDGTGILLFSTFCMIYLYSTKLVIVEDPGLLQMRRFGFPIWSVALNAMVVEEDPGVLGGIIICDTTTNREHLILWSMFPRDVLPAILKAQQANS